MILMNGTRSGDSGFTAFQVQVSRAKLAHLIRERFIAHLQTVYCHEQTALALYRGLAARTADSARRDMFLRLAQTKDRRAARLANILQQLNTAPPRTCAGRRARIWQRLLVRLGPRCALAWIEHMKRGDTRRQIELTRLLRTLRD